MAYWGLTTQEREPGISNGKSRLDGQLFCGEVETFQVSHNRYG